MLYILGRRPLRTTVCDICRHTRFRFRRDIPKRLMSTAQNPQDLSADPGQHGLSGRIHVLGLGNVGGFVAHCLASRQNPPPITLCLHSPSLYSSWVTKGSSLTIDSSGLFDVKHNFDVNALSDETWYSMPNVRQQRLDNGLESAPIGDALNKAIESGWEQAVEDNTHIDCLVLCVKAQFTVNALQSIKSRLSRDSTVLFMQNGMGVVEKVNREVFPSPETRPHYISGVISHGLSRKAEFYVAQKGVGTTLMSPVLPPLPGAPRNDQEPADWAPTTKYMLRTLALTPRLVAVTESPADLLLYQLEKLAVNAVINPLTTILGCRNGELLYNYPFTRLTRMLLLEFSTVICALPELKDIPGIQDRFAPERLRALVTLIASKTADNRSSMLQDVESIRLPEIHYINGWIVNRGEELGIKCAVNYMVMQMVLGKLNMLGLREAKAVPMEAVDEPGSVVG